MEGGAVNSEGSNVINGEAVNAYAAIEQGNAN